MFFSLFLLKIFHLLLYLKNGIQEAHVRLSSVVVCFVFRLANIFFKPGELWSLRDQFVVWFCWRYSDSLIKWKEINIFLIFAPFVCSEDPFYTMMNKFLLQRPCMDISNVPLFSFMFNSASMQVMEGWYLLHLLSFCGLICRTLTFTLERWSRIRVLTASHFRREAKGRL